MKRAERAARTVKHGTDILTLLKTAKMRSLLVLGVQEGIPPVSKVSSPLIRVFSEDDLKTTPVKSFIGLSVRAVLAEEDCERVERGVRTNRETDPLFSTGSVYRQVDTAALDDNEHQRSDELIALVEAVCKGMLSKLDRKYLIQRLVAIDV